MIQRLRRPVLRFWMPWLILWLALLAVLLQQLWPLWNEHRRLSASVTSLFMQAEAEISMLEEYTFLTPGMDLQEGARDDPIKVIEVPMLDSVSLLERLEEMSASASVHLETVELPVVPDSIAAMPQLRRMSIRLNVVGSFRALLSWLEALEDSWPASNTDSWQLQRRHSSSDLTLAIELQLWGCEADQPVTTLGALNASQVDIMEYRERNDPFQTP